MSNRNNYISTRLANINNISLSDCVGQELDAKVVKVRWNKDLQVSEVIYEIDFGGYLAYAVDVVTQEKRRMYLDMFHASKKTIEAAMDRTNSSLQFSLSACFGYVSPYYDLRAKIKPFNKEYGTVGIEVLMPYELKR